MKEIRIAILCIIFGVTASFGQSSLDDLLNNYNTRSVPYISVEELKMRQYNEEVLLLDTRERIEFDVSHIPSAKFVGYSKFSSELITEQIQDKDATIVVYCSLGVRSEVIGEKLKKAGFTKVYNLYGGIFEWKNRDYAVVDASEEETENVHICTKAWGKWLNKGVKVTE
jgi:rhodanese-related sulfurtransferase